MNGTDPGVVRTFAPGRVNLIGDHTDTTGGWVLPMAVDLGTTVEGVPGGATVTLHSDDESEPAVVPLDVEEPSRLEPTWARYVAGVVAEVRPTVGFTGRVTTTLPIGAGLSSSAALEVALALALDPGAELDATGLALRCRAAEERASGVPCGIMDQLTSAAGVHGHALLIDCHARTIETVPVPEDVEVRVVHSGQPRTLAGSAYAVRRAECEAAESLIGPLRLAKPGDERAIENDVLRRRARHVITENARVHAAAVALRSADTTTLGALMGQSHASLRDDFEVSIPAVDALVDRLRATKGVFGARMTGGGFGGCVVAINKPGALAEGWGVYPSRGAQVLTLTGLGTFDETRQSRRLGRDRT